jgi:hypothetical protein
MVQDATLFVQSIGEKYLWVDSLCIAQDDIANKHDQIKNMNMVYSKAFATIVALSGRDASATLPGVRPATRSSQKIEAVGKL